MGLLNKERFYIVIFMSAAFLAGFVFLVLVISGRLEHKLALISFVVLAVSLLFSMTQLVLYLISNARLRRNRYTDIPTVAPSRDADDGRESDGD